MAQQELPSVDNWDDFSGDYLKAEYIETFPVTLVCINVKTDVRQEDNRARLIVHTEYKNKKKLFVLNKTNIDIVKKFCKTPKELIGKKLICEKIKQRNPATNTMVDSILIDKIE